MEWGTFVMELRYMIVPRGYTITAQTPSGSDGMKIQPNTVMWVSAY